MTRSAGAISGRDRETATTASQGAVAATLAAVSITAGAGTTLLVLPAAAITRRVDLWVLGGVALVIALAGARQRVRGDFNPLHLLFIAATGCAAAVPFVDRAARVATLPALMLFAFVGVFTLTRRAASWFMAWCGCLALFCLPWMLPEIGGGELALSLVVLSAVGFAAWRLTSLAGDALMSEETSNELMLRSSPVAILEEDFTRVETALEELRAAGVVDLVAYLRQRPDETRRLIGLIKLRRANPAALDMIGAESEAVLVESFHQVERADAELGSFVQQFVAIWEGHRRVALDLGGRTLDGASLEVVMHWTVPEKHGRPDLSRVVVTFSDITPRKVIEDRLAAALESNQRLLNYEQALASCTRALVLSNGQDGLDTALEGLRSAIGADRAYLSINFEDPVGGASFRMVASVHAADFQPDDREDETWSWADYRIPHELLSSGKPYERLTGEPGGDRIDRSVLGVPVFSGGKWIGTVGFVEIGRTARWAPDAVRMLQVAAPMIGTFWEREVARSRLEDLVRSKDRFIASVSHELRTPLAAVLGFAEELRANAEMFQAQEVTEILELIADQSQDMADMVEDLLVSARAEIGTITIRPKDVYLRSQAEAELAAMGVVEGHSVSVVGSRGKAWADPTRTRQIIRNLLTNAIRYGGARVEIEAIEDGALTTLEVRDDGPGLEESEWETIFEPYVRAHESPTQPASIGLGLTVSRQLARLMGGDLVYTADRPGSVFRLTLPVVPPDSETGTSNLQKRSELAARSA